jgi:hypothetical protein
MNNEDEHYSEFVFTYADGGQEVTFAHRYEDAVSLMDYEGPLQLFLRFLKGAGFPSNVTCHINGVEIAV